MNDPKAIDAGVYTCLVGYKDPGSSDFYKYYGVQEILGKLCFRIWIIIL